MRFIFTDNSELGSTRAFRVGIHNNFTHHSHSTEVTECSLAPEKDTVNPYLFTESFDIPSGLSEFETNLEISIPSGNINGDYDEGDYHFFISLTDKEGWSAQKGMSIKYCTARIGLWSSKYSIYGDSFGRVKQYLVYN